jgi:fructose-bisphosphate aldolase class 1
MRIVVMIMVLLSSIYIDNAAISADPAPAVSRVITSFDLRYTGAVLHRVSRLLSGGFGSEQADTLLKEIEAMRAEAPMAWHFSVTYKGRPCDLQIRALVDELGMIDLDFATDPELATQIRATVDSYLSRRN